MKSDVGVYDEVMWCFWGEFVRFWIALCVQRAAAVDVIAEVVLTDDLF